MALSDILQKIKDEAGKKAAFMKQVSDDQIQEIRKEAVAEGDERRKSVVERADMKSKSLVEKAGILAKMEGRNKLLSEKRQVIDDVYAEAEKELSHLKGADLSHLLVSMLKAASKSMPKGHLTVASLHKREIQEAIDKANVEFTIRDESPELDGGFILSDGKQEMNLSFNYLLKSQVRLKTELEVAKLLFD